MKQTIQCIHQLVPYYGRRDAIGEDVTLIQAFLRRQGYSSEVIVERGDLGYSIKSWTDSDLNSSIYIYHHSVYSEITMARALRGASLLIRYHNITPSVFFSPDEEYLSYAACYMGRQQNAWLAQNALGLIADSNYNQADFASRLRFQSVIPVFRDYARLARTPSASDLAEKLRGAPHYRMLFVGRLVPNKAQHDLIRLCYIARQVLSERIQLVLVGSAFSRPYEQVLKHLASSLGLSWSDAMDGSDVVFLGSVSEPDLADIYRGSDVFVSLSEHEGFCVPLVEAMHFEIPVIAHKAAAVPEVLGDAALLVDKADPLQLLNALNSLLNDNQLRNELKQRMKRRRENFAIDRSEKLLLQALRPWTQGTTD